MYTRDTTNQYKPSTLSQELPSRDTTNQYKPSALSQELPSHSSVTQPIYWFLSSVTKTVEARVVPLVP
jgi:hypothetical protein